MKLDQYCYNAVYNAAKSSYRAGEFGIPADRLCRDKYAAAFWYGYDRAGSWYVVDTAGHACYAAGAAVRVREEEAGGRRRF